MRTVVGYAVSRSIDARLTVAALETASERRRPPASCIHDSDRGSQYAGQAYRDGLAAHDLVGSLSRRGNSYDNAKAKGVMKTLKRLPREGGGSRWSSRWPAKPSPRSPRAFIDNVYNAKRPHAAPGYLSPRQFADHNTRRTVQIEA